MALMRPYRTFCGLESPPAMARAFMFSPLQALHLGSGRADGAGSADGAPIVPKNSPLHPSAALTYIQPYIQRRSFITGILGRRPAPDPQADPRADPRAGHAKERRMTPQRPRSRRRECGHAPRRDSRRTEDEQRTNRGRIICSMIETLCA